MSWKDYLLTPFVFILAVLLTPIMLVTFAVFGIEREKPVHDHFT